MVLGGWCVGVCAVERRLTCSCCAPLACVLPPVLLAACAAALWLCPVGLLLAGDGVGGLLLGVLGADLVPCLFALLLVLGYAGTWSLLMV